MGNDEGYSTKLALCEDGSRGISKVSCKCDSNSSQCNQLVMTWTLWLLDPVDHEAHFIIWSENSVGRACAWLVQGHRFESHSGQLSKWGQKNLAQNEDQIYW